MIKDEKKGARPLFIDSHAHMNFSAYDEDRDEVIDRALKNDVLAKIFIGKKYDRKNFNCWRLPKTVYDSIQIQIRPSSENITGNFEDHVGDVIYF